MKVKLLNASEKSGLVRVTTQGLTALLESSLPFVGLVTGPDCPRCEALKKQLMPLLEEQRVLVFEIPYFDTYRKLRLDIRTKFETPKVYAFPTLIFYPRDPAPFAVPYTDEGVEAMMETFEANTEISNITLTNEIKDRGWNSERFPTLVVESKDGTPSNLNQETNIKVELVVSNGTGTTILSKD